MRPAKTGWRVFHWSGENSESARREAAERLLTQLVRMNEDCESDDGEFHIIAHSHAGNIVWETLRLAGHRSIELLKLGRWITVGTPYLRFRWDAAAFFRLLVLLVLLGLSLIPWWLPGVGRLSPWQWSGLAGTPWDWFWDYWSRFDAVSTHPAGANLALAVVLSTALVMLLCLVAKAGWETYCYWNSHQVIPGDRRGIEFSDTVWGWTSILAVAIVAGRLGLFVGPQSEGPLGLYFAPPGLSPPHGAVRPVSPQQA